MDRLLQQKNISELDNQRQETFAFLTRFGGKVMSFSREYDKTYEAMTSSLKQESDRSEGALQRLKNEQQIKIDTKIKENRDDYESYEKKKEECKAQYASKCRELETDFNHYRSVISERQKERKDDILQHIDTLDELCRDAKRNILVKFSGAFGYEWGHWINKKMNEKMCRTSDVTYSDLIEAHEAFNQAVQEYQKDVKQFYSWWDGMIPVIHVFQQRSMMDELCELYIKMKNAADQVTKFYWVEYDEDCEEDNKKIREKQNENDATKKRYDEKLKKYLGEISSKQKQSSTEREQQLATQKKYAENEYSERKREYQAAYQELKVKWEKQLDKLYDEFEKEMLEIDYPPSFVKALYSDLRDSKHIASVETLARSETKKNVLIGEAYVPHANAFYQGKAGNRIRDLMKEYYYFMFAKASGMKGGINYQYMSVPYTLSIAEGNSIFFLHEDEQAKKVKSDMNAISIRMLLSVPVGQMRFRMMDAESLDAFIPLKDIDPAQRATDVDRVKSIILGKLCTDEKSISEQIEDTVSAFEKMPTSRYHNLLQFNRENPMSTRPFETILAYTYPNKMSVAAINNLQMIVETYKKWGITNLYALSKTNEKQYLKDEKLLVHNKLMTKSIRFQLTENGMYRIDGVSSDAASEKMVTGCEKGSLLYIYPLPAKEKIWSIGDSIFQTTKQAGIKEIGFTEAKGVMPSAKEMFLDDASNGIEVPLGYNENGSVFSINFSDVHIHALINGSTGSGKTNLLHVLLCNAMLRYTRSALELYLIDFKHGADFKMYAQYNLQNFRAINICNEPEFALAMLEHIEAIFDDRNKNIGVYYSNIIEYNRKYPDRKLSRILLVIDEFNQLVESADSHTRETVIKIIKKIAVQGRSFGIHFVISGQHLNKVPNIDEIKKQCATRIVLKGEPEDVKFMMGEGEEKAKSRMNGISSNDKGHCVVSTEFGADPFVLLTAKLEAESRGKLLQKIDSYYTKNHVYNESEVFATDISQVGTNRIQFFWNTGIIHRDFENYLLFASPISMEKPLFPMDASWWFMGGNTSASQKAAFSAMFFITLALILRKWQGLISNPRKDCFIYVCDGEDNNLFYGEDDRLYTLCQSLPKNWIQYYEASQGLGLFNFFQEELTRRMEGKSDRTPLFLIVPKAEYCEGFNHGMNALSLCNLISKGPEYGIYSVIWTQDMNRAKCMQLNQALFQEKIVMQTDDKEAEKLANCGSDYLKEYRAYLCQAKKKVRIYDLPSKEWVEMLLKRFTGG